MPKISEELRKLPQCYCLNKIQATRLSLLKKVAYRREEYPIDPLGKSKQFEFLPKTAYFSTSQKLRLCKA